jgi:long-chain fatty acid transport protein
MGRILTTASIFALGTGLGAGSAIAGGTERAGAFTSILFEKGTYVELGYGYASPDVSGTAFGRASGDMAPGYGTYSFGYKQALSENLDFAIVLDEPIGADVDYPAGNGYALAGTSAKLRSDAITALLRYEFPSHISVFGGIRSQASKGDVTIIAPGLGIPFYNLSTNTDREWGYILGAAWEKPEIAARVSLTYTSAITHTLTSTENGTPTGSFETEVPQSLDLAFQTGIAPDTLLFGSVRWAEWSAFDICPAAYLGLVGSPLVSYQSNRVTYNIGVGRRFNETWSGAVTASHEASNGDITGNLGPTDGFTSLGLGVTYTKDNFKITGGVRYIKIGDATTRITARFTDNDAVAAGIKLGYSF